jgi:addiction module HigA family antidote
MARKTEYPASGDPAIPPLRPGAVPRDDALPALELGVGEAARQLGVARRTLHRTLAGTMAVSPAMALRLGRFRGNGPGLWHAERTMRAELAGIPSHRTLAA